MLWFSLEKGSDAFNKNNVMVTVETFVLTGGGGQWVTGIVVLVTTNSVPQKEVCLIVNSLTHFNPYYHCYI